MAAPLGRGQVYVISAPSGVGKTTLIGRILTKLPFVRYSVSCTTRLPRSGETPGKDYHFLSREEFQRGIGEGRFLEWAVVHDAYYGTDGNQVNRWLQDGWDVLLDIDVQGARQIRCAHPQSLNIFILPPSMEVLEERLLRRGTESAEQLKRRLAAARDEIMEAPWYDFIIVNDLLHEAAADLESIFRAQRCRRFCQSWRVAPFLTPDDR